MRTALVTITVFGIILVSQVSARPEAASAQARGRAGFQGYWMGIDPVDGGDARRSLILRSDGKSGEHDRAAQGEYELDPVPGVRSRAPEVEDAMHPESRPSAGVLAVL